MRETWERQRWENIGEMNRDDRRGCYFCLNHTWMCLPNLKNLTFSIPIFRPITHPSVYLFRQKRTKFCPNWVFFTIICSKTPNFWIWAPSSLMKTHRSLYQISQKSTPKGRHIYVYQVNVSTPPGRCHGKVRDRQNGRLTLHTLPYFRFLVLLWFVIACYVIFDFYMVNS